MSVIQGNAFSDDAVDTGDIGHSLRFRGAQYLNRTPGGAGSRRILTYSAFLKVSPSAAMQRIFVGNDTGSSVFNIAINASNQLEIVDFSGSYLIRGISTRVFRDPTAHIHLVVALDTNQATFANAVKVWANNEQITSWGTSTYSGAHDMQMNDTRMQGIGVYLSGGVPTSTFDYYGGYLSRVAFVDGTALTPSSFGYLNTEINEWVTKSQSAVKAVVDAGGTNSFMLDFDDATSLTTLGYDKSSKGNNWTLNGFSLTAGTTYDHMLDVPGNSYCTINHIAGSTTGTASDGNLKLTTGTTHCRWFGTMAMSAGSWVWEGTCTTAIGNDIIGIIRTDQSPNGGDLGDSAYGYGYRQNGDKKNNTASSAYGASYTSGDVIRMEYNATTGTLVFFKNGVSQGAAWSGLTGEYYPAFGDTSNASGGTVWNLNFGQAPLHASATYHSAAGGYFRDAPTSGFKALCQANLPDVAIKNPKLHFDIKTRTGTAATYSVTGLGFQPDLVWSKSRGRAVDHALYDSVRGVQKQLESNSTGAETTETTGLTAFNSDGYTGGALDQINGTTATNSFVDWLWKAGGAAVSNTAGSITSQVSANVDAGFSIVTYTGTGANATVGHGLTKVPKLVIAKQRTAGTVENWAVSHTSIANTEYLLLNTTAAKTAGATYWNSTTPTTSVFSVGSAADTNESAKDFVAYCFADIEGYSKAFSYTGNGSADGPYVHLGFKPRWIMLKRSDSAADWILIDTARDPYNHEGMSILYPHAASAEYLGGAEDVDLLSNGFKPRDTHTAINASSGTYIGLAIADVAGKYSLGR